MIMIIRFTYLWAITSSLLGNASSQLLTHVYVKCVVTEEERSQSVSTFVVDTALFAKQSFSENFEMDAVSSVYSLVRNQRGIKTTHIHYSTHLHCILF